MAHIFRSTKSAEEVAKGFAAFCKSNNVITRGYVRVGKTPRGLRGLIAAKDIPKDDNVVIVPDHAILTSFETLRSTNFIHAVESQDIKLDFTHKNLSSQVGGTFIYDHHVMLALYISHTLLAAESAEKFRPLVDYMPRSEANFTDLTVLLERAIDHSRLYNTVGMALANHHHVSPQDFRSVLIWALCMVISRSVPLEHTKTIQKLAKDTPLEQEIGERETGTTTNFHLSSIIPLLDMINHDENDNVAIAVPDVDMKHSRCVIARSLRPISKGEEITMKYGGVHDPQMLKIFYGIPEIIPVAAVPSLPYS